jgi:hypothetical protein
VIHFISRYFYTVQRNKVEMLTRAEKRKACWLLAGLILCVITLILIWMK